MARRRCDDRHEPRVRSQRSQEGLYTKEPASEDQLESAPSGNQLRAIGRVNVSFSRLVLALEDVAHCLLGVGQQLGRVITSEMSFRQLLSLVSSLARLLIADASAVERIESMLNRAAKAEERRNIVDHSIWAFEGTEKAFRGKWTAKKGKGWTFHGEEVDVKDMEVEAVQVDKLVQDLTELLFELAEGKVPMKPPQF